MSNVKLGVEEARQAETTGRVRYILLGSLLGTVVTMAVASALFWSL